jgi:hypothetical protein
MIKRRKSDPTSLSEVRQRHALELLDAAIAALDDAALQERLSRRPTPSRASLAVLSLRRLSP